jgi:hypothetical protein
MYSTEILRGIVVPFRETKSSGSVMMSCQHIHEIKIHTFALRRKRMNGMGRTLNLKIGQSEKKVHCCMLCTRNSRYPPQNHLALTLASVPSIEYPVIMSPFRASGAQSSNNSRLGPTSMNPGLASTTQGGPSAIFFSHPRVCGTCEMCLKGLCLSNIILGHMKRVNTLEDEGIIPSCES